MSESMRALVLRQHGGLENLELVKAHPKPGARAGSAVIRVRASSFNYHDVFTVQGMPGTKRQMFARPFVATAPKMSSLFHFQTEAWHGRDVRVAFNCEFWPNVLEAAQEGHCLS